LIKLSAGDGMYEILCDRQSGDEYQSSLKEETDANPSYQYLQLLFVAVWNPLNLIRNTGELLPKRYIL
jgi:hypothetical protein